MLVGDVHLADRPPSVRTETYAEDILAKLRFASTQAALNECEALVLAGDVFHIKAPSRTSHRLVQQAHEALREGGLPVLIVPGNHDMSHDRLDSIDSQPLGSLCRMEGVSLLVGWHPELPLFGFPWTENDSQFADWANQWLEMSPWQSLMVTHASIFPPGDNPPYQFVSATNWARMMSQGACYYGHIHDPHGTYSVEFGEDRVQFCNNGALSRGSLHEQTLKRQPAITLYDDELPAEQLFRRIEVPHRPASEVFRLVEVEEKAVQEGRLDEFLAEIGSTSFEVAGIEQLLTLVEEMDLRPETRAAIRAVVEEVQSQ